MIASNHGEITPAPQLHELLRVMPKHVTKKRPRDNASYGFGLVWDGWGKWECRYFDVFPVDGTVYLCKHSDPNPADAVGRTLIWLIENEYVEVKDGILSDV